MCIHVCSKSVSWPLTSLRSSRWSNASRPRDGGMKSVSRRAFSKNLTSTLGLRLDFELLSKQLRLPNSQAFGGLKRFPLGFAHSKT